MRQLQSDMLSLRNLDVHKFLLLLPKTKELTSLLLVRNKNISS